MKSVLVLGMGRFGSSVATTLYSLGNEVLVIDRNADRINDLADSVTHAIVGDICDEGVLKSVGARNFDIVIIAASEDIGMSMMTAMTLKELGAGYIIAKAQNELHGKLLAKIGVDKVIRPEHDMGVKMAHAMERGDFIDFIELSPDYSIAELEVPHNWYGKTISELAVRAGYGINILAVKTGNDINAEPHADFTFAEGNVMIVMGSNKKLAKLR